MLSRLVSFAGLLVAVAAAAAAALIVVRAPSMNLALAAIALSEKSYIVVGAGVLAAVFALMGSRPGLRGLATLTVLLSLAAIVMALGPAAQALRLASERRANLDFGRYLRSRIDTTGPVKVEKTVPYATVDGRALELDAYAPGHRAGGPAPVVLVVHGGGWSTGTKGESSLFSRWLADQGYAVFDVDYRMAPQPNWKAAVGDVKCAIGWIKEHAASPDWNLDPSRITLLGRSAGAHLALLAAYTTGDPALPPSCDAPNTTVESVVDLYGPTDLSWGYAYPVNPSVYDSRARETGFIGGPPQTHAALYRQLSPTERVTAASPRTLVIHGGRDQIVSKQNSDLLTDRLHAAGVRYETLFIPYAQHGFDFVFGGLSEQILETVLLRFLEDRPKPATSTPPPSE